MLWALVITGLMFADDGKLKSVHGAIAFTTPDACERAAVSVRSDMSKAHPGAKLLIGCVPLEKPVKS